MKLLKLTILCAALALSGIADAKGGMSSGGGRSSGSSMARGGFSSSGSRPAAPMAAPRPNSQPSIAPTARPNSQPSIAPNAARPNSQPSVAANTPRTTTTTTTTTSRTYSSRYVTGGGYYGGWGMGYHYNNGLMTGLIIGSMMHPHGTIMYAGPGMYANNAVLYPNGQVVNQQGYVVGTYVGGQFMPVQNGAMVAQPAPEDAGGSYQSTSAQSQPVVMVKTGPSWGEITMMILVSIAIVILVIVIFL